jgi:CDP-6-deoxy-D-xylo-4-hexulose-3-dehydrase
MRLEDKKDEVLRQAIFERVREFYNYKFKKKSFERGKTKIPYAGRVFDENELISLIDASLDFWLTAGRFSKDFEDKFTKLLGIDHCLLTNSGSSANLLAISALTSHALGERRLKPGDEVITVACAFPTTVNPIIQNNLVPVFVDIDPGTYNIIADKIEPALSKKTKAIFLAHTLGNPFDLSRVIQIAQKHNLWVIEDACDALGSKYDGRYIGTFGDIATFSFYPAHHITMGEGGAVVTNSDQLKRIIQSFRDWGRDCWCGPGEDNTCRRRFGWQLGELPFGYDHKYIYSHIGYNLKITDMQAAIGVAQLKKLPGFIEARRRNWEILHKGLKKYKDYFILPRAAENSEPSWFGLLLTRREDAPFSREEIITYLEKNNIATRMLFSGNIIRHPYFSEVKYRIYGGLKNTDNIMKNTFWIGVYPGMTENMIEFILGIFHNFFAKNRWLRNPLFPAAAEK